MIFGKNLIIRCLRDFVLSHFLVLFSQLVTSTNRFCRIVMDLKINIAYFPFQVNGIKVSLPNKDGSSINRWAVVHVQAAYQLLSVQFRTVKGLLDSLKL
jgi:hypothetical protein